MSIVTPSYNQGQFIEETIRSVLLQGYPNLEYIIIDGGSTDGSVEIVRKYEPWLAYWVSEPDRGQSHAIVKGFSSASGEILGYLNSDDFLLPNAIRTVAQVFRRDHGPGLVYGDRIVVDQDSHVVRAQFSPPVLTSLHWGLGNPIPQESSFWRRGLYEAAGGVREDLFFVMDFDLSLRLWRVTSFRKVRSFLGTFRQQPASKSSLYNEVMWTEFHQLLRENGYQPATGVWMRIARALNLVEIRFEQLTALLDGRATVRRAGGQWRWTVQKPGVDLKHGQSDRFGKVS